MASDSTSETAPPGSGIAQVYIPQARDLGGGLMVGRMLPHIERRSVGPFVFLDQMGPHVTAPGQNVDVRPHPHIGLATVTYLFEGEIVHRDSIGSVQAIRPGDVNWMTAGRGIVHSERMPPERKNTPQPMFGLQFWVGLPIAEEEMEPDFAHHAVATLPMLAHGPAMVRLVVGRLLGKRSPVATRSETLLVDIALAPGARFTVPAKHAERGLQLVQGTVEIGGASLAASRLLVLEEGRAVEIASAQGARLVLFGGDPLDGPRRHLYWNFVASDRERIERAKAAWRERRFPAIPGETEFIPLPA